MIAHRNSNSNSVASYSNTNNANNALTLRYARGPPRNDFEPRRCSLNDNNHKDNTVTTLAMIQRSNDSAIGTSDNNMNNTSSTIILTMLIIRPTEERLRTSEMFSRRAVTSSAHLCVFVCLCVCVFVCLCVCVRCSRDGQ